ncbi:MAG: PAS domain-containing protein [Gammaproteobacteria bacterium]|nr:MAG: PAS domain-containing protein [Gammaproteobacteria bacterium]
MDIPQSWQEIMALAQQGVATFGRLSLPGLEVMDGLLLVSAVLLLTVTLFLLRQRHRLRQEEQARNNAEALASSLFDALPDAAAITDPEGCFLSVNPAFARLVGRAERDITGARLTDLFTPAVAEHFHYRPVESEDDEPPESFRIRADHPTRFIAHKIPLFDIHGLLVGVLTQLRPAEQVAPLAATGEPERPPRRQASPALRTTAVSMDIQPADDQEISSPGAPSPMTSDSDDREASLAPPITSSRSEEETQEATRDDLPSPDERATESPASPAPESGLAEALQIAVRISGEKEKDLEPSTSPAGSQPRSKACWSPVTGIEVVESEMLDDLADIFRLASAKKS